jgi:hypothetical protein
MTANKTILLTFVVFLLTGRAFTAENRVLELDGSGSYVELPADIFNNLEEATVEGWVKWDDFGAFSRFFDFGEEWRSMNVTHVETTPTLGFTSCQRRIPRSELRSRDSPDQPMVSHRCRVRQRRHELFNGLLVGTNTSTSSFATLKSGKHNYLGKSNWSHGMDRDFQGQMDEVRVWKVARSRNRFATICSRL